MRAIIINPQLKTVTEAEIDASLETLQRLVGGLIEPVGQGLDEQHVCYVNEEGLLCNPQHFFMFRGGHQPLAGTGVILGSTEDGDNAPCALPIADIRAAVTFMDRAAALRWARQFCG